MVSGISKKLIFFAFLFINFFQPSNSADLAKVNKNINNQNTKLNLTDSSNKEFSLSFSIISDVYTDYVNLLQKNLDPFLLAKAEKQQELIIQSDKQSEINDVIYAEGNVSISYRGKLLKADNLIYDKLNKKINATGNVCLLYTSPSPRDRPLSRMPSSA